MSGIEISSSIVTNYVLCKFPTVAGPLPSLFRLENEVKYWCGNLAEIVKHGYLSVYSKTFKLVIFLNLPDMGRDKNTVHIAGKFTRT